MEEDERVDEPYEAMRHLELVSRRETALSGVPTGVLLVAYRGARSVTAAFKREMQCLVGKKAPQSHRMCAPLNVPGTDGRWLIYPMSVGAASLLPQLLEANDTELARVVRAAGGRFFPGVRRCDSFFAPFSGGDRHSLPSGLAPPQVANAAPSEASAPQRRFTFAECFAGIGGFRLALEPLGGACVYASEINLSARATYALNFGDEHLGGDVTDVYAQDLPPFDLLTAGFPCQPFSQRGDQAGFDDPRGQMYTELVRLLTVSQPKAFLFENVPALVLMSGGWRPMREAEARDSQAGATLALTLTLTLALTLTLTLT